MLATTSPFALDLPLRNTLARAAWHAISRAVERASGLATLADLYDHHGGDARGLRFCGHALGVLDITLDCGDSLRASVPAKGALVVVANHPLGLVDGLAVGAAVAHVRSDVKALGNHLLARIPEVAPFCVPVNVYSGRRAVLANARALRGAVRWLRDGHALIVFPAGQVAHEPLPEGAFTDAPWSSAAARLARLAGAMVLPAHIDGRPSRVLRLAGRLHWSLRTALLPRELLRHRRQTVTVTFGRTAPPYDALRSTPAETTALLRARCYALAPRARVTPGDTREPVAPPGPPAAILDEIGALPPERTLVSSGPWRVVLVRAPEAPALMDEIGRLRELTFRAAGEGTGRARDIDSFDPHYLHLVLWRADTSTIVGAYRLGPTDEILASRGPAGLYTRSLFRFGRDWLYEAGPALELGRAFVRPEYQREVAPLALLWRGIAAIVARQPRYRRLFGPVSLSADYPLIVRKLIVGLMRHPRYRSAAPPGVGGRRPFAHHDPALEPLLRTGNDLPAIDALVKQVDPLGRGLPVLLRQYLRLGGRVLAFSVDPDFGGVVDGLVIVDLARVDRTTLTRFMGPEAAAFLAHHHAMPSPSPCALEVARAGRRGERRARVDSEPGVPL